MTRRTAALALAAGALPAAKRIRVLILTGSTDELYHHWRETTPAFVEMFAGFETKVIDDIHPRIRKDIKAADVLFLNYNGPRFAEDVEKEIEQFVEKGGGFAAFHQACYGEFFGMVFEKKWRQGDGAGWVEFPLILGARWDADKIGHARRTTFQVDWIMKHPIAGESFTTDDELYHRMTILPSAGVLAHALSPADKGGTGKHEPMIWVNRYGKGRVFFTPLGHDVRAITMPGVKQAFIRGIEWAATGKVKNG